MYKVLSSFSWLTATLSLVIVVGLGATTTMTLKAKRSSRFAMCQFGMVRNFVVRVAPVIGNKIFPLLLSIMYLYSSKSFLNGKRILCVRAHVPLSLFGLNSPDGDRWIVIWVEDELDKTRIKKMIINSMDRLVLSSAFICIEYTGELEKFTITVIGLQLP